MTKRTLSLLLAGILIFFLLPARSLATESTGSYQIGDIVEVAGTAAPTAEIPEHTGWKQQGEAVQKPGTEPTCGKVPHTHVEASGCDLQCTLQEHTHTINCEEGCTLHIHTQDCCKAVHVHGDNCNCQTEVHSHNDSCYTSCPAHTCSEACQIPEDGTCPEIHIHDERCVPSCGKEVHSHSDACCTALHQHSESCVPQCGQEGHTHITNGCGGEGICTAVEHAHGDGSTCVNVCILEEHTHTVNCDATCSLHVHTPQDCCNAVHDHSTGCNCQLEAHSHSDGCYGDCPELHTHSESCPVTCGKALHTHTDTCCTAQHQHSEACIPGCRLEGHIHITDGCGGEGQCPLTEHTHSSNACPTPCPLEAHSHDNNCYTQVTYTTWELVNVFTVTFNSNGGTDVEDQAILSGDTVTEPEAPARAGYVLEGWYREAALTTPWNFETDTVSAPVTLYAKWTDVKTGSVVTTDAGSWNPIVDAGTLDAAANAQGGAADPVAVRLTIRSLTESSVDETEAAAIDALALGRELAYLDMTLEGSIGGGSFADIGSTNDVLLEVTLDFDASDKRNIAVFRYHNGKAEILSAGTRGERFLLDQTNKKLTIFAKNFSTYAIGYTTGSDTLEYYQFSKGSNSSWAKDSSRNLVFVCKAPYALLEKMTINGQEISLAYAESCDDGTQITLKPDFLKNLARGKYYLELYYRNGGYAIAPFTVTRSSGIAYTSDLFNIGLWGSLLGLSAAGVVLLVILKKRKK